MNREDLKQYSRQMLAEAEKNYISAIFFINSEKLSEAKRAAFAGKKFSGEAVVSAGLATLAIPPNNTDEGLAWIEEYERLEQRLSMLAKLAYIKIESAK